MIDVFSTTLTQSLRSFLYLEPNVKRIIKKNIEKYYKDPLWLSKMNVHTFKNTLKKHFLEYYWLILRFKTIRIISKKNNWYFFSSFLYNFLFDDNFMKLKH